MESTPIKFWINPGTENRKTGPIATLRSDERSCPSTCPWKEGGCYGKYGPLSWQWRKMNETGWAFSKTIHRIRKLPFQETLRLFEVGDCPGDGKKSLHRESCLNLAKACKHVKAFGYSHYPPNKHNLPIFKEMNETITLSLSADNPFQAAKMFKTTGMPIVSALPEKSPNFFYVDDVKFVVCPWDQKKKDKNGNIVRKVENCKSCGGTKGPLCLRKDRDYVIGFPSHGIGRGYLNRRMSNVEFVELNN